MFLGIDVSSVRSGMTVSLLFLSRLGLDVMPSLSPKRQQKNDLMLNVFPSVFDPSSFSSPTGLVVPEESVAGPSTVIPGQVFQEVYPPPGILAAGPRYLPISPPKVFDIGREMGGDGRLDAFKDLHAVLAERLRVFLQAPLDATMETYAGGQAKSFACDRPSRPRVRGSKARCNKFSVAAFAITKGTQPYDIEKSKSVCLIPSAKWPAVADLTAGLTSKVAKSVCLKPSATASSNNLLTQERDEEDLFLSQRRKQRSDQLVVACSSCHLSLRQTLSPSSPW